MLSKEFLTHRDAWRDENIYRELYEYASKYPEEYWMAQIDRLSWIKKPTISYDGNSWFTDGKINACYNCVDRHYEKNPDKVALIWQSEDINVCEKITYNEFHKEVIKIANVLKKLGLDRDNYVTIYMPMVKEAIYSCLACARLGIPYLTVFAGFSPSAIALRMQSCGSNFVITCDANRRGGKVIPLKNNIDEVRKLYGGQPIKTLVFRKQNIDIPFNKELDIDYSEISTSIVDDDCPVIHSDSNDDLFVLHTSGSVGKPKGIVQGTGGFLLFSSLTHKYFFDIDEDSIFWCSGDIGWMGGHAYSMYAPLCNGITTLIYEGVPTYPDPSIFSKIIDKHKVTSFNTAPTALRAMMQYSDPEVFQDTTRDTLKVAGVFGEILNKEVWSWYFEKFGNNKTIVVNMWGQTELGGVPTAPLCNMDDMKTYGHIGRPFLGCNFIIKDEDNIDVIEAMKTGALFIKDSMPGMLKRIQAEPEGMYNIYYSRCPGIYCTGDEAYYDSDGFIWITGRVDDVLNVSGHRVSAVEIEDVIYLEDVVSEVSIVGYPHDLKGEGIYAFIVLKKNSKITEEEARKRIINRVKTVISPITKPDIVTFVDDLPKTRSGKIMRRILRKIAAKNYKNLGDTSSLQNPECIEAIRKILQTSS
ncbi:MAG: acetate--CoA ligase [Holosporales bacterium]|jgi:acetyl-CoA synthetase|nr:acetate--CoA ligase [Holosporales bacterium]